jgi:hypothetical protein
VCGSGEMAFGPVGATMWMDVIRHRNTHSFPGLDARAAAGVVVRLEGGGNWDIG